MKLNHLKKHLAALLLSALCLALALPAFASGSEGSAARLQTAAPQCATWNWLSDWLCQKGFCAPTQTANTPASCLTSKDAASCLTSKDAAACLTSKDVASCLTSKDVASCLLPKPSAPSATPATPAPSATPVPSAKPVPSATPATNASDYATAILELVNQARAKNGLSPLVLDAALSRVAQAKARDMHDNGYFAHESPSYGTPFEMMRSFGITYKTAGENIAMGYQTAESVMNGWMNSEGHRANILKASFTTLGVGYVADGNYWVQMFLS